MADWAVPLVCEAGFSGGEKPHCKKGSEIGLCDLRLHASNMAICMVGPEKLIATYSVQDSRSLRIRGINGEASMWAWRSGDSMETAGANLHSKIFKMWRSGVCGPCPLPKCDLSKTMEPAWQRKIDSSEFPFIQVSSLLDNCSSHSGWEVLPCFTNPHKNHFWKHPHRQT